MPLHTPKLLCWWLVFHGLTATAILAEPPKPVVPHRYDRPPNEPLTADEAARKMTVPDGFTVEVVAAEPDLVNPVAMTFDERGRIWVTESLEYPRHSAGPGRDRIKILEDTDGDGRCDKVTIFAEGLNIPSGIAVGAGGVWVANAPDVLFLQATDGDDRADKQEVVVTGFGRADTHELPNSLTWGPDGWLYGLNGVFNPSKIVHQGKTHEFTCAMFRIHPRTRAFELFCEGTSNPWGIAFNEVGEAFVSACVIDHLWHLVEGGYYHRQGGPYPPHTWKIESIVKHKHQKAAYCGIHWFDSDAYPERYREKLYMGNIHGNCLNVDRLEPNGSTYRGLPEPDFLAANDDWFMPVVQKTGPDGCLYILDWYDRYHCYQDANRDPKGIDRLKGRLYRVRYKDTPRAPKFDLAKETDDQLVERLKSPNVFYRDLAQRLLRERAEPKTIGKLQALVLDKSVPLKIRMHALWAVVGAESVDVHFHVKLLESGEPALQAWAMRAAGNSQTTDPRLLQHVSSLIVEEFGPTQRPVMLQALIAASKLPVGSAPEIYLEAAKNCGDDRLVPHLAWNHLREPAQLQPATVIRELMRLGPTKSPALSAITPRLFDLLVASPQTPPKSLAMLIDEFCDPRTDTDVARRCLAALATKIQTREITAGQVEPLRPELEPLLTTVLRDKDRVKLHDEAALLGKTLGMSIATLRTHQMFADPHRPVPSRIAALEAIVASNDPELLPLVRRVVTSDKATSDLQQRAITTLARVDRSEVAELIFETYDALPPSVQPVAIELLTQRPAWAQALVAAVATKKLPAAAVNTNQVLRLQATNDSDLKQHAAKIWGAVRTTRNPEREQVVATMRELARNQPGDPNRGQIAFAKLCGQCHKIYGQGADVGPDITANGRANFEQLLSNVFDPSLVIGNAYQARIVQTTDGRTLTGLLVEDNPARIVLKLQGGRLETIARSEVDEMAVSKLSLMPEGVEKQYQTQEIADLLAFLVLDRPPSDPQAKPIPGTPTPRP